MSNYVHRKNKKTSLTKNRFGNSSPKRFFQYERDSNFLLFKSVYAFEVYLCADIIRNGIQRHSP